MAFFVLAGIMTRTAISAMKLNVEPHELNCATRFVGLQTSLGRDNKPNRLPRRRRRTHDLRGRDLDNVRLRLAIPFERGVSQIGVKNGLDIQHRVCNNQL
jgi:hypothetical protein